MWTSSGPSVECWIWLVTAWVFEIFLDSSRSRSSMFLKSMLPPTLSWYVWSRDRPRSSKRRVSTRCTMVAPTWDLMSSPTIGTPASWNLRAHTGSEAMKTGMALTKATPASMAHWA